MGTKWTRLLIESAFGDPIELKVEIIRKEIDGFNMPSGGWCLYKTEDDATPAEYLVFRKFRKRHLSRINCNRVISQGEY